MVQRNHSHMKATEQYFPMVLFIMLYKMVLTFVAVDEYGQSNESYRAVLRIRGSWARIIPIN